MRDSIAEAVRDHIAVPPHVRACAGACQYDLLYGPSWSAIPSSGIEAFTADHLATYRADLEDMESDGATLTETYVGPVGEALRAFLEVLPSTLYVDDDCGICMESEPEGEFIDGETFEPCDESDEGAIYCEPSPFYALDGREIVEALFGRTIAREFN